MNKKLIMMFVILALTAVAAFAQEAGAPAAKPGPVAGVIRWGAIGASFLLGIAAAAGAIGQGRAIAASVEGIARNPGAAPAIRLAMIIGLALIESLVIYSLVIAYLMYEL